VARAEVEAAFAEAPVLEARVDLDKGHGRIEERRIVVLRDVDWLESERHFPGELRLPRAACLIRAETRGESRGATRTETRYFISSRALTATDAAAAVRGRWGIENRLHWVLDVAFADDHPDFARATARETWPPSALSPSTSSGPRPTSDRSVPQKARRLVPRLPTADPLLTARMNWIRSPESPTSVAYAAATERNRCRYWSGEMPVARLKMRRKAAGSV